MRFVFVLALLVGCEPYRPDDDKRITPAPVVRQDPSLALSGAALEDFCRGREHCATFANCVEVAAGCDGLNNDNGSNVVGCDPYLECRAKRSSN